MIIQINATVCAAVNHGEDEQLKIACSDQERIDQYRHGRGGDQKEQ